MKRFLLMILGCVLTAAVSMAQVTVKGVVMDPDDEPAIGATVYEKGNKANGTATNMDGEFTLKVASLKATLVVSYIGMQTQEVALNGQDNVTVVLKEDDANRLDEVVVVGYGTQKKINATGAVKTIDNKVLEARPISNAVQGLQGAVAGLNITNDAGGAPGQSMSINIRGVGSIGEGSTSSPLVLIDGMEGDLTSLNPNDIENISVLKDAAAASIYGSRAPFGVILVTTKNGQQGTTVNYSGNVRFQKPNNVPKMLDSYTFALVCNDAYDNTPTGGPVKYSASALQKILDYQNGLIEFGTGVTSWDPNAWYDQINCWGNTNWYDVFVKDHTTSTEHNLSISGGGDKVTYFLSGNYLYQTGLFNYADEKYQRLALSSKVNVKFNQYVNLQWTTRIQNTENEKPSALNDLFFHNIGRRYTVIPLYLPHGEYHQSSMVETLLNGGRQNSKTNQVYNQANLVIEPIKNWKLHAEVNSRVENNPYTRQMKPIYYTKPNGDKEYLLVFEGVSPSKSISGTTFNVNPATGENYYERAHTRNTYFSTNFYTDYEFSLAQKHNFKFLAGVQTEYYHYETDRTASSNIVDADTPFFSTEKGGATVMIVEGKGEWSSVGIFGRINYNFENKYMLEFNLRADGASRFPKDQRWGTFPSVSVGWNIAQEQFWQRIAEMGFHYFKLRGSYGVLGNQNTSSYYPYYQSMSTGPQTVVLGGVQVNGLPAYAPFSSSLTWEKIENWGVGVDMAFMNNRLNISADWYQRTTKDMVGPALSLAAVYGASAPSTNNAELRNRGWELEVSWNDRINKDWSYSVKASLSDYKSVVTKYSSSTNSIDGWYEGKDYGDIWGYKVLGVAKSDAEMENYLSKVSQSNLGTGWGGGDFMYVDVDGDGSVDGGSRTLDSHGDLVVIGNNTPRYAFSFTLESTWKFLDIRAYFQGIGKRDYFLGGTIASSGFAGWGGDQWQFTLYEEHLDYFRFAGAPLGENTDAYYGRIRTDSNNIYCSDRLLQNAAYLRLKNLTIGVSLPRNTKLAKYVKKARLYFSGENLFTITSLKIFDPEGLSGGWGAGKVYPMYRTYSLGLELTF